MGTLKEARDEGNLDKFAEAHDADPPGDGEALEQTIRSMAGTSSALGNPARGRKRVSKAHRAVGPAHRSRMSWRYRLLSITGGC